MLSSSSKRLIKITNRMDIVLPLLVTFSKPKEYKTYLPFQRWQKTNFGWENKINAINKVSYTSHSHNDYKHSVFINQHFLHSSAFLNKSLLPYQKYNIKVFCFPTWLHERAINIKKASSELWSNLIRNSLSIGFKLSVTYFMGRIRFQPSRPIGTDKAPISKCHLNVG